MKFGKKGMILLSIAVGTALLTTSALADIVSGSGYKRLKESGKKTMAYIAEDAKSFTADAYMALTYDEMILLSETATTKFDRINKRYENSAVYYSAEEGERKDKFYRDESMNVSWYNGDDTMNVYYYQDYKDEDVCSIDNPFEEEFAADVENVIDSFVGSLQDSVQAEENDSKTMYTCDLDASQIPAYINALSALGIKSVFFNAYRTDKTEIQKISKGVYISSASAKAIEDENGYLSSIMGTAVFKGKDENGSEHEFKLDLSVKIYDVSKTVVEVPQIDENADISYGSLIDKSDNYGFVQNSVGSYERDIVDKSNGMLEKIGERELIITEVSQEGVKGHYSEIYLDGKGENLEFDFTAEKMSDEDEYRYGYGFVFSYRDADGNDMQGIISGDYEGESCRITFNVEALSDDGYTSDEQVELIRKF